MTSKTKTFLIAHDDATPIFVDAASADDAVTQFVLRAGDLPLSDEDYCDAQRRADALQSVKSQYRVIEVDVREVAAKLAAAMAGQNFALWDDCADAAGIDRAVARAIDAARWADYSARAAKAYRDFIFGASRGTRA
jgi:hypothetical protein